jgi:hypothetical protein
MVAISMSILFKPALVRPIKKAPGKSRKTFIVFSARSASIIFKNNYPFKVV